VFFSPLIPLAFFDPPRIAGGFFTQKG